MGFVCQGEYLGAFVTSSLLPITNIQCFRINSPLSVHGEGSAGEQKFTLLTPGTAILRIRKPADKSTVADVAEKSIFFYIGVASVLF